VFVFNFRMYRNICSMEEHMYEADAYVVISISLIPGRARGRVVAGYRTALTKNLWNTNGMGISYLWHSTRNFIAFVNIAGSAYTKIWSLMQDLAGMQPSCVHKRYEITSMFFRYLGHYRTT
jgi:hypothetical protein